MTDAEHAYALAVAARGEVDELETELRAAFRERERTLAGYMRRLQPSGVGRRA